MKTREQAKAYIEYQLSDDYDKYKSESFKHNEKYNYLNDAWHYGKIELNELLDYIYEEKTGQEAPSGPGKGRKTPRPRGYSP